MGEVCGTEKVNDGTRQCSKRDLNLTRAQSEQCVQSVSQGGRQK